MIVADASYFVALADRKDRWHRDALRVKAAVPQEFLVSDLVVAEAVTIIGDRRGGKPAQTLYEYFDDECEIVFVGEDLFREAMALHLQYDGGLSVADCVNVALMSQRGIRDIVSFDHDLDKVRSIRRLR